MLDNLFRLQDYKPAYMKTLGQTRVLSDSVYASLFPSLMSKDLAKMESFS